MPLSVFLWNHLEGTQNKVRKHCQGPNGGEQEDGTNMQVKYDFNALFICTAMNYSRRLQQEGRDTVHLANSTTPFTAPGRKVTAVHCRRSLGQHSAQPRLDIPSRGCYFWNNCGLSFCFKYREAWPWNITKSQFGRELLERGHALFDNVLCFQHPILESSRHEYSLKYMFRTL